MPGPEEGNAREKLLPWNDRASARIVLGANVAEACEAPAELDNALTRFRGRQYALTYRCAGCSGRAASWSACARRVG